MNLEPPLPAKTLNYASAQREVQPGPWGQWMLAPLGLPFHVASAFVVIPILVSATIPGGIFVFAFLGGSGLLVAGGLWIGWSIFRLCAMFYFRKRLTDVAGWRGWFFLPAMIVLMVALLRMQIPMRIIFAMNRAEVDRVAGLAMAEPVAGSSIRHIGSYRVSSIQPVPGGLHIQFSAGLSIDPVGFAYFPNGSPVSDRRNRYELFTGPWYIWRGNF